MRKLILLIIPVCFIYYSYIEIKVWKYILATLVIIYCYKKVFSFKSKDILSIRFHKKDLLPFLSISIICALIFNFYIELVLETSSVVKGSPLTHLLWFIQPLFQSFNEEVFFRAQYFHFIKKWIKSSLAQSLIFSTVFSVGHGIFFIFAYDIYLNFNVYLSLFVATLIMNHLFLTYKSIILSWAIHFGINFSFFGGKYFLDEVELNDPQKFNLILGDSKILIPSVISFILFISYLTIKNRNNNSMQNPRDPL